LWCLLRISAQYLSPNSAIYHIFAIKVDSHRATRDDHRSPIKMSNHRFWKNVKIEGVLFWKIVEFAIYLLCKNAKGYAGKKNITLH